MAWPVFYREIAASLALQGLIQYCERCIVDGRGGIAAINKARAAMSKSLEHRLACPLVEKWRKNGSEMSELPEDTFPRTRSSGEMMTTCADELETFWRKRVEPTLHALQEIADMNVARIDGSGGTEAIYIARAALAKVKEG
jgi:hypothetical protein